VAPTGVALERRSICCGDLCVWLIVCWCGCPCFWVFSSEIVCGIVWLVLSLMEICERVTWVVTIFWWFSSLKSGFSWCLAWAHVFHSIWLGTPVSVERVCRRSLGKNLLLREGVLAGCRAHVDRAVEALVEDEEEVDQPNRSEDLRVRFLIAVGAVGDRLVLSSGVHAVGGVGNEHWVVHLPRSVGF
jgi:hypothetical protein